MEKYSFDVTPEMEDNRLDVCISELVDHISRSYIQKLIKEQKVFVNSKIQKANYRLKAEDRIEFVLPDAQAPNILAENIPLDILYEDSDVLVVNKPKGMVVHPAAGHYTGTLVNAIMYYCKSDLSGINGIMRPGIVHRIDKDTTGSVIICKNDFAHNHIACQLKEHSIKRIYRAIVCGCIKDDVGIVNAPIGRHPNDRKKMTIIENGKKAITHYKVLERFKDYTYMEFCLETGRTHQIRVHMASIQHPLLGDIVYGNGKDPFHTNGQVLHAYILGFVQPQTNEFIETVAPIPNYFEQILTILRNKQ